MQWIWLKGIMGRTVDSQHMGIHKRTWKSPDGNVFNQTDHILIAVRYCSDLRDARSYRGANTDSDHYLIKSKKSNAIPVTGSGGL
jgi:hypothetical protein